MTLKAFTFVEIILSVSILFIVGVFGVFSFFKVFHEQEGKTLVQSFENNLKVFDAIIEKKEISEYTLSFSSGQGFTYSLDDFSNPSIVFRSVDFSLGKFEVAVEPTSPSIWSIEELKEHKKESQVVTTAQEIYGFSFSGGLSYEIQSIINNQQANTVGVEYFSADNTLFLESISSSPDKNSSLLTSLTIQHTNGIKYFSSGGNKYNNVYFHFLRDDTPFTLHLNTLGGR